MLRVIENKNTKASVILRALRSGEKCGELEELSKSNWWNVDVVVREEMESFLEKAMFKLQSVAHIIMQVI